MVTMKTLTPLKLAWMMTETYVKYFDFNPQDTLLSRLDS